MNRGQLPFKIEKWLQIFQGIKIELEGSMTTKLGRSLRDVSRLEMEIIIKYNPF